MEFKRLAKLRRGDKVAVLSPSFAAPAKWPHVYELGLQRLREVFGLDPVAFPTTAKLGASAGERARDLAAAFERPDIKAVIASLGGDDQVTYIRHLPREPFVNNPKPYFGYSDNTHFINHLWLLGIPSYYGGHLFTEFALQGDGMDAMTVAYLEQALFSGGTVRLEASACFSDIGLDWGDAESLRQRRRYQENEGWYWDGADVVDGITWGGCLESIDEMLRHGVPLPAAEQWSEIVLFIETSEEIPSHDYVFRVLRALGERGLLERVRGLLVGRPKAWEFDKPYDDDEKLAYKQRQRETIVKAVRPYNNHAPIVQNLDFGHTAPQICLPAGRRIAVDPDVRTIEVEF